MKTTVFILAILLLFTCPTNAEIPRLINYQAKLADSNGNPITGTKPITFKIYDSPTSNISLWGETQQVTFQNGVFNVLLGSEEDLELDFDKPYYLGIKVDEDAEMNPRQQITTSAYAFRAKAADSVASISIPLYIKGFKLVYVDSKRIKVTSGVVDIAGELLVADENSPNIAVDDPSNYIEKNVPAAGFWAYVYLYNDEGSINYKLSQTCYELSSSGEYRCIGAVRIGNAGSVLRFYQEGPWIIYDIPQMVLRDGSATSFTDIDCSAYVPEISEYIQLAAYTYLGGAGSDYAVLRPDGSGYSPGLDADDFHHVQCYGNATVGQEIFDMKSVGQIVEYKWLHSSYGSVLNIWVKGYYIGEMR